MKKLENKVALVTGGSRGIGAAIAYALAEEGAHIGLTYVVNKGQAEQVCESIRKKYGIRAIAVKTDITVAEEVQKMAEAMLQEFERIDILVNNAGIIPIKKLADTSLEDWHKVIATNLTSVFLCTKAVLPSMLSRGGGRIINIGSTLGLMGSGEMVAYSAAKGGVIAFTKSVARELAQHGILVNCVAPGPVETDNLADISPERRRVLEGLAALGRISRPEEIATSVVFLASPDSDVYVGQTICPNGGEFMI